MAMMRLLDGTTQYEPDNLSVQRMADIYANPAHRPVVPLPLQNLQQLWNQGGLPNRWAVGPNGQYMAVK